ncbi:MAG: 6-hydroxymethylpterin diphosphokinase MptE-like protein [Haloglomus sp.]
MEFDEWNPVYERLLFDLGYDRDADERARDRLAALTDAFDLEPLYERIDGATVAIAGGADTLASELEVAREADVVLAASVAADICSEDGVDVDCLVTDLDKNPGTARHLTHDGVPVAAHAHGDNIDLVESVVPDCDDDWLLPTTQAAPVGPVRNFGGFTDGDRAAFLADHLGAASLRFPGWDLEDPNVGSAKRAKLDWAARLLRWLEHRRDEQFGPLDGRRAALDDDPLTPPYSE